jgi:hypothetical protein
MLIWSYLRPVNANMGQHTKLPQGHAQVKVTSGPNSRQESENKLS